MLNGELQLKLDQMTQNAINELDRELHPTRLEEMLKMEHPVIKLITISKYEGYGLALKDLGADTKRLEIVIENEAAKMEPEIEKMIA